jgi:hypothetical protein
MKRAVPEIRIIPKQTNVLKPIKYISANNMSNPISPPNAVHRL